MLKSWGGAGMGRCFSENGKWCKMPGLLRDERGRSSRCHAPKKKDEIQAGHDDFPADNGESKSQP